MKVVAFNGSPRKNGNTAAMLDAVLRVLEENGIETELAQIGGENIRPCNACYLCAKRRDRKCAIDDDIANECISKMMAADGIIIGSPTYFADVTPETKALIDRAGLVARVNGDLLRRKVGAAVVVERRAGSLHAFDTINHFFTIGQMIVVGSNYWNMGIGKEKGEVLSDNEGMDIMKTLGENMAWLLKKLSV